MCPPCFRVVEDLELGFYQAMGLSKGSKVRFKKEKKLITNVQPDLITHPKTLGNCTLELNQLRLT